MTVIHILSRKYVTSVNIVTKWKEIVTPSLFSTLPPSPQRWSLSIEKLFHVFFYINMRMLSFFIYTMESPVIYHAFFVYSCFFVISTWTHTSLFQLFQLFHLLYIVHWLNIDDLSNHITFNAYLVCCQHFSFLFDSSEDGKTEILTEISWCAFENTSVG